MYNASRSCEKRLQYQGGDTGKDKAHHPFNEVDFSAYFNFNLFHVAAKQLYILFCGELVANQPSQCFSLHLGLFFRNTDGFQFFDIGMSIKCDGKMVRLIIPRD